MNYSCCQCGGPVPEPAANYPAQLGFGGPAYRGELKPELLLCSRACGKAKLAEALGRKTCAQCGDQFAPKSGVGRPGRPAVFCSPACNSARDRLLNRAMRALARGTVPARRGYSSKELKRWLDDIQQVLDEAVLLGEAWARGGSGAKVEPDARAVKALQGRIEQLAELRNEATRALVSQQEADVDDAGARTAAQMIRPRPADQGWADRLLAAVGSSDNGSEQ